jgi:hypothetical protein
MDRLV